MLFVATFFIYSYYLQNEYQKLAITAAKEKVKADIAIIDKTIAQMQYTAQNIALFASNIYKNKTHNNLDAIELSYLSHILKTANMYNNIGVWFEPYAFDNKQKDFAIVAFKNPQTQKVNCLVYQDNNVYDYHKKNWYKQFLPDDTKKSTKTTFGNRLIIPDTNTDTLVGAPVYDEKDNIIGITTINTNASDFLGKMVETNNYSKAKIILADKVQNKALYFDAKQNAYLQTALSNFELSDTLNGLILPEQEVLLTKTVLQENTYYMFTAATANNMLYSYAVPQEELFSSLQNTTLFTLIILGLLTTATIFMTTHLVYSKISKPIKKISKSIEQSGNGFISELEDEHNNCEEISILIQNFNELVRKNNLALKRLLNNISHMLYIIDTNDFTIKFKNKYMHNMFPDLEQGEHCYKAMFDKNRQCSFCPVSIINTENNHHVDVFNKKNNYSLRIRASLIEWDGKKDHAIISISDITKDYKEKNRLEILAETDDLTGVLNRRGGLMALEKIVETREGTNITIALIDINGLKSVNDLYGHFEGDFYINTTVRAIKQNIRSNDLLCRMGGDEFMIILPNCREENILGMFMRINNDVKIILEKHDKPYKGSFAFGTHTFIADKKINIMHNINSADKKMYENKNSYYKNQS